MFRSVDVNETHSRDFGSQKSTAMDTARLVHREFWIQCDTCQKWRRTTAQVAEKHSTCHWSCGEGGRACQEPCDYCLYRECRCDLISDDGAAWCVNQGYTIPPGFTMHIKSSLDDEEGPCVVYRALCDRCRIQSEPLDRRGKVESWLRAHAGCRAEWARLDPRDFDFHVDEQLKNKLAEAPNADDGVERQVQVQPNGQPSFRSHQDGQRSGVSNGNSSEGHVQQGVAQFSRPVGAFEGVMNNNTGAARQGQGIQLWGPLGSTVQVRQNAMPQYPQNVQYRNMWNGNPYGQYGWIPLSDHPQFRHL